MKSLKTQLKGLGELVGSLGDVFSEVTLVSPGERRETGEHFIEEAAQRPDISLVVIKLALQHFGSHLQRGATCGFCKLILKQLPSKA